MHELTAERLREVVDYDAETGAFTRKVRTSGNTQVGRVVGNKSGTGYLYASVLGRRYSMHRLAWLYVRGRWPNGCIDHINGNRHDNRIRNLRECTKAQNQQNRKTGWGSSKLIGASFDRSRNKWVSQIKHSGKNEVIGYFDTDHEAHAAYIERKTSCHPFFKQEL